MFSKKKNKLIKTKSKQAVHIKADMHEEINEFQRRSGCV